MKSVKSRSLNQLLLYFSVFLPIIILFCIMANTTTSGGYKEVPLISISNHSGSEYYSVQVLHGRTADYTYVRLFGISVKERGDGKDFTSILLFNDANNSVFHESGIILVPFKEDVKLWQKWLDTLKEKYEKKPQRVLPPKD